MNIFRPKIPNNFCDEVRYDCVDGKLTHVDFFLNRKNVLTEFKDLFSNLTLEEFKNKIQTVTGEVKYIIFLRTFHDYVKDIETKKIIKQKIFKMHQTK